MLLDYVLVAAALLTLGSAIGVLILTRVDDGSRSRGEPCRDRETR